MRPLGRNIPWKSISIPWIRRSKGWNFRSKATFQWKNSSETCHIVAKTPFSAVPAAVRCTDVFHYQTFLIFVHLPPGTQGHGKIAFSVLKGRRSSPSACCRGWLCRAYACSTPLGPYIYMWLSFRGFAMLTRGYRVVRPPWGRRPRRHSAAKSRERRRPRRHPGSISL